MNVRLGQALLAALASTAILTSGCDTGNPSIDRGVGTSEVVVGEDMQVGGGAMLRVPDSKVKAGGFAAIAGGTALEEDGRARINRANARESATIFKDTLEKAASN